MRSEIGRILEQVWQGCEDYGYITGNGKDKYEEYRDQMVALFEKMCNEVIDLRGAVFDYSNDKERDVVVATVMQARELQRQALKTKLGEDDEQRD